MQVNLVIALFVLESEKNTNIRKNDIKKIKVLVTNDNILPKIKFTKDHMKSIVKETIKNIIHSDDFYLDQVVSIDNNDNIDIVYLAITNSENINELDNNYKLVDFSIRNNHIIFLGTKHYFYKTSKIEDNKNIDLVYDISAVDSTLKRSLLELLICFNKIRKSVDNTDIVFKFLGNIFTLEDVRIVYEMIKDTKTDKSNFRKRIIKYCVKVNEIDDKNAYRPSQKYKYKVVEEENII
jgi:hypothetical protein